MEENYTILDYRELLYYPKDQTNVKSVGNKKNKIKNITTTHQKESKNGFSSVPLNSLSHYSKILEWKRKHLPVEGVYLVVLVDCHSTQSVCC